MNIMNWTAARENTSTHMRSTKNCLKYVLLKKFNVRINLIVCITLPLHWIPLHCVKHRRHSSSAFLSKSKTSPGPLIDNILSFLNRAVSLKNCLLRKAKFLSGDFPDYLRLLRLIELRAANSMLLKYFFIHQKKSKSKVKILRDFYTFSKLFFRPVGPFQIWSNATNIWHSLRCCRI